MPEKNAIKKHIANATYHIYNRGNNKAEIFLDNIDYEQFLYVLGFYLTKPNKYSSGDLPCFYNKIKIHAYCLMPNHFHLLVTQKGARDMSMFMRSAMLKYIKYFNKRHKRVGHLCQSKYKARLIDSVYDFIHVSKYIHLNPKELTNNFYKYPFSSLKYYIAKSQSSGFLYTREIKQHFGNTSSKYKEYLDDESQT